MSVILLQILAFNGMIKAADVIELVLKNAKCKVSVDLGIIDTIKECADATKVTHECNAQATDGEGYFFYLVVDNSISNC